LIKIKENLTFFPHDVEKIPKLIAATDPKGDFSNE